MNRGDEPVCDLTSLRSFCRWLEAFLDLPFGSVVPDTVIAEMLIDGVAAFRMLIGIEIAVGEDFPGDLIDAIGNVRDLYEFAVIKQSH